MLRLIFSADQCMGGSQEFQKHLSRSKQEHDKEDISASFSIFFHW